VSNPGSSRIARDFYRIIDVLDAAKGAGVERVGIVTDGMRRAAGVTNGL
jgi:hypothetical protein